MPLLEVRNLYKIYRTGDSEVRALNGVNLRVEKGELVAVIGASGSGKSTLMNILGCLDVPSSGEYLLDGRAVGKLPDGLLSELRNLQIGFIFQGFNLIPSLTALENVELPLIYRGCSRAQRRRLALDALDAVGLSLRAAHRPGELSGGQQQRVAIARAVAARPPILLADEPTGNLDTHAGREILDVLRALHREGRTVLIITHDPAVAERCERIISVSDGRIISDLPA